MSKSKIEWCDRTWNPVTGCSKVSPGCLNCYAERMAKRFGSAWGLPLDDPFKVTMHSDRLAQPLRWTKPSKIFVCSMSDLFHNDVPDRFLDEVFGVILASKVLINHRRHTFLMLTKRPERMHRYLTSRSPAELLRVWAEASNWITLDNPDMCFDELVYSACCHDWDATGHNSSGSKYVPWGYPHQLFPLKNLWLGVTAENQEQADKRIPLLLQIPAVKRFVSVEPMLGPVDLNRWIKNTITCNHCGQEFDPGDLTQVFAHEEIPHKPIKQVEYSSSKRINALHWVICGGESGTGARPTHPNWVRNLRDQCLAADIPFMFKQWGEFCAPSQMAGPVWQAWDCYHGTEVWDRDDSTHWRIGQKKAGRLLDGQLWDQYPNQ